MRFFASEFNVSYLHVGLVTGNDPTYTILPKHQELLGEMYDEAIELVFASRGRGENLILLQVQDIVEALVNKLPINKMCNCGGSETVALDWDGCIYPCNFFFGNYEYSEGNLVEKNFSLNNPQSMKVDGNIKEILEKNMEKCQACWTASFCTGCLGNFILNSHNKCIPDFHCQIIKRIVKKIIFQMTELNNNSSVLSIPDRKTRNEKGKKGKQDG
ncbi:MAG: SPASM domain-containing protein [Acidobacteria bacterium]|jgi:radical SAM protein with 4Fe4S-binding SPASM domain|nr:SPASM domain-containing protein [Acidobacteriota bacterium]